ncbi:MAG: hypothetical protein Q8943_19375, partial [Bacteroidota bacterium]|nr:hypothetical protein [Bacteroidota bacterium]
LDSEARTHLKQMTQWARICAIVAFIGYAVSLAVAIFGTRQISDAESSGFSFGIYLRTGSIIGVLITITVGGILNYFLYRFSVDAAKGLESMDTVKLNEGLGGLRTYFKIVGILTIIILGFVALAIIFVMLSAGFSSR